MAENLKSDILEGLKTLEKELKEESKIIRPLSIYRISSRKEILEEQIKYLKKDLQNTEKYEHIIK